MDDIAGAFVATSITLLLAVVVTFRKRETKTSITLLTCPVSMSIRAMGRVTFVLLFCFHFHLIQTEVTEMVVYILNDTGITGTIDLSVSWKGNTSQCTFDGMVSIFATLLIILQIDIDNGGRRSE